MKWPSEYKWCVNDQIKFDQSPYWYDSNYSKIGWEICDENCNVEDERECDTSRCTFPFELDGHYYNGCTHYQYSHPYSTEQSYCITNQKDFKGTSKNLKPIGWTICSSKCPVEHKICEECEFPFEYDGRYFNDCTKYRSDIYDESKREFVPWCKVNTTKFNYWKNGFQWQYCSWSCRKDLNGTYY